MSVCKIVEREGKCELKVITKHRLAEYDEVVRWCSYCGAVVIDEDYDGRTNPGSVRSMEFPIIAKERK